MKRVGEWKTGSRRGYVHVKNRGVEDALRPIPQDLTGLRGNKRWAMRSLLDVGATHYTTSHHQGVPGKGYSNSFCFTIYTGYKEEEK